MFQGWVSLLFLWVSSMMYGGFRIMVLGSLLPDFSDIPTLAVQSFSERIRRAPGQVLPYFQALGFGAVGKLRTHMRRARKVLSCNMSTASPYLDPQRALPGAAIPAKTVWCQVGQGQHPFLR